MITKVEISKYTNHPYLANCRRFIEVDTGDIEDNIDLEIIVRLWVDFADSDGIYLRQNLAGINGRYLVWVQAGKGIPVDNIGQRLKNEDGSWDLKSNDFYAWEYDYWKGLSNSTPLKTLLENLISRLDGQGAFNV